jgi:hypothetical protein
METDCIVGNGAGAEASPGLVVAIFGAVVLVGCFGAPGMGAELSAPTPDSSDFLQPLNKATDAANDKTTNHLKLFARFIAFSDLVYRTALAAY